MLSGFPTGYWIGFHALVLVVIACDFALFREKATPGFTKCLLFVLSLIALAAAFCIWLIHVRGSQTGLEFASAYLIELSLSIDNLFIFLIMFRSFGLDPAQQRRVLLLGIAGAIVMRGLLLFFGVALIRRFAWLEYVFGGLLLLAAVQVLRANRSGKSLEREQAPAPARWAARIAGDVCGRSTGVLLTAAVAIEFVDLVFAVDSIPAVLAVSRQFFVVYTSNVLAILGLRALYFLIANLLGGLRFLHFALGAILAFVGLKMLLGRWVLIPTAASLGVIVLVLLGAAAASLLFPAARQPSLESSGRNR